MVKPTERTCRRCGETKELTREFFNVNQNCRDGFNPRCKVCVSKVERLKRESRPGYVPPHRLTDVDPDTREATCYVCGPVKAHKKGDRWVCAVKGLENGNKAAAKRGVRVGHNKDYHYLSDIDEDSRTATCRQCGPIDVYPAPHKTGSGWKCGNKYREHLASRLEESNEYKRAWVEQNQESVSVSKRKYKAKRKGWEGFRISERDRKLSNEYRKILATDPCFYCGTDDPWDVFHVDHYVPLSKGGTDHWWNLVSACETCNMSKKDRDPRVFLHLKGRGH